MMENFTKEFKEGSKNILETWNKGFLSKVMLIKLFKDRAISWVSIISYIQTLLIFFQVFGFSMEVILITIGLGVIITFITILDFVLIMAKEQGFLFKINEEFREVKDAVTKEAENKEVRQ